MYQRQRLNRLAQTTTVRPSAQSVAIAQNRVLEKNFIRDAGLPVAPFVVVQQASDLPADGDTIYPAILKVARFGYDGKWSGIDKKSHRSTRCF